MNGATVGRCLLASLGHAIIAKHGSDAQTIVPENPFAAGGLRRAMTSTRAPSRDSVLVTPKWQGQQLVGVTETLESLHGYETVHALKLALEACGILQIIGFAADGRKYLKDITAIMATSLSLTNLWQHNKVLLGHFGASNALGTRALIFGARLTEHTTASKISEHCWGAYHHTYGSLAAFPCEPGLRNPKHEPWRALARPQKNKAP
jgi:hypothetical protein